MRKKIVLMVFLLILLITFVTLIPGLNSIATISPDTYFNEINQKIVSKGNITVFWENTNNEVTIKSDDLKVIAQKIANTKYYLGEDTIDYQRFAKKKNSVVITNSTSQLSTEIDTNKNDTVTISINELANLKVINNSQQILLIDISDKKNNHNNQVFRGVGNINDNIELLNEIVSEYERMGWGD